MSLKQSTNFSIEVLCTRLLLMTGAFAVCLNFALVAHAQNYVPQNDRHRDNPIPVSSEDKTRKAVTPEEAQKLYNRPKTNPPPKFDPKSQWPRIAGEFEEQNAIMISVSELLPQHASVLKRIAELTENHVPLIVLFNDSKQVLQTIKVLQTSKQELSHVKFMHFKLDTVWIRDFGPVLAQQPDNSVMSIDFFYSGQRPTDDHFPRDWAKLTSAQHNSVPWTIQGGNLLSNGIGLALTTTRILTTTRWFSNESPASTPKWKRENSSSMNSKNTPT